jgi:hypothetical protein
MMFGGGIIDLRTYKSVTRESVPPSVQLLFENTKLDLTKTILVLYAYSLQSQKKYRKISEIVFYYSLVNFELIELYLSNVENKSVFSTNQYFRFQFSINQILLQLSQLGYIEVKGSLTVKADDIGIRITPAGVSFVEQLNSEYFRKLVDEYTKAINTIEFSSSNLKILRGERSESDDF